MNPSAHSVTLAVPPDIIDHAHGPEHAPVTVVEYGDFECPGCKNAAQTSSLLLERYPGKVRFIFRHFPVEQAHPHALRAAEAAEAAGAQGKFWPLHDLLLQNQAHLKDKDLQRYAAQVGVEMVRFIAELEDHFYLQKVREQMEGGRRSHIRATPTFFVNGGIQDVSFGLQGLHNAVAAAVRRAQP